MVTGFNTDVEHDGRTVHVQTEDRGRANPIVETLVYAGGEIVTSRRTSYADSADGPAYDESVVQQIMESQHQALIREILEGRFDPEGPKPFGYHIITNRSLDEVVRDVLAAEVGTEGLRVEIEGEPVLIEATEAVLGVRVVSGVSGEPVPDAHVILRILSATERPRDAFSGPTDAEGRVEATVAIPEIPEGPAALLCQAECPRGNGEVVRTIVTSGSSAAL